MKTLTSLLIGSALFLFAFGSAYANSGNGNSVTVGNGGQTVVCTGSGGKVTRQTFDLYEGQALFGSKYISESSVKDPAQTALAYAQMIDATQGDFPDGATTDPNDTVTARVQYVIDHMRPLNNGVGLDLTNDTDEFISLPQNCQLVQTINYRDSEIVYYDPTAFNPLSNVNKAALYLHEGVYSYLRATGVEKDSRRTRRAVSYLFAGGQLMSRSFLTTNGLQEVQYCRSNQRGSDYEYPTRLIAYRDSKGNAVVQFLQVGGYRFLTQSYVVAAVPGGVSELPLDTSIRGMQAVTGPLRSLLDLDSTLKISWGNGRVTVGGVIQPSSKVYDSLSCVNWPLN